MSDPVANNAEILSSDAPATSTGNGTRRLSAGIAGAAVIALVAAGGVYAYSMLSSSDDYPYSHLSDGAFAYVQTNTDPSAGQKLALRDLAKKFPELEGEEYDALTSENVNAGIVKVALDSDSDFSWVGDRLAFAGYPDNADEDTDPQFAILLEAKDEASAKKGLETLLKELAGENLQDVTGVDPGAGPVGDEAPEFKGAVYDGKWVGITDGELADIFESESSLADNGEFQDAISEEQGNVLSAWVDAKGFADALRTSGEEDVPDVTGTLTVGLEARKDGLDLRSVTENVKIDGKAFGPNGDAGALNELLSSNSYDDAALSLGIAGLGESAQKAFEADTSGMWELDENVKSEDMPGLIGDRASLSIAGSTFEDIHGRLVLAGVSEETWNELLANENTSFEELQEELAGGAGIDASIELENDQLMVQVGADEPKGDSFEEGQVSGKLRLDPIAAIFHSLSFTGEEPEGEAPTGLGEIEFRSNMDDDGSGESVVSWNTPR